MAEASELPRVLDIRAFVNAREAELASLLETLRHQHAVDGRFAAAALPRHLRR